jgi:trk system potassium uptake protein TrkH
MRLYNVVRYVALAILINSVFMLISALISAFNSESSFIPLLYSALITVLFGVFPLIFVPPTQEISNKEGLLIVVLSWFLSFLAGTLPYVLYGGPFTFTNAWFESVSGYTTTGSSILAEIEVLPLGLLFWRASTHWIGGIGIIIFVLAVLPFIGLAEVVLFRSELSNMVRENFRKRAGTAIRILAGVYIGLTLAETILLYVFGMSLFDAVTHSFATIATGGFSTKNSSIAWFKSPAIEWIITIFMFLSGIHFALLFTVVSGNLREFWRSSVVRFYSLAMVGGILLTAYSLKVNGIAEWTTAFRLAALNLVSVGTSTGFASADTAVWPGLPQLLIIYFMLQGACAGSTTGGMKSDRVLLLIKSFGQQLRRLMYPNAVIQVYMDKSSVRDDIVANAVQFIGFYLFIVFSGTLLEVLTGLTLVEAFSGTVATLGGVGPGLGSIGSMGNFSAVSAIGKWIFSILMIIGRLEIFAFFIFFHPKQWSKKLTY